ncbi:MAG: Unknown protein [uncultured Campylobacterales bacterium]|uniref:DUF2721 domain-containing protein n=1 Tax=uncultured Campylobacterales bacterium TaxID=352960 RepID=A0A6S6T8M1_9BACT|nr:MAG: Unknown protein [uncultured Campylobacterales bacterium]
MTLEQIMLVLQLSIGPVIVISGVGLLLLSMTNRYARVIDRCRSLSQIIHNENYSGHKSKYQLDIFVKRASILRLSIIFASFSLLFAAFLIICLFIISLFELTALFLIVIVFSACLVSLILSLIIFIVDINISLRALKIEVTVDEKD